MNYKLDEDRGVTHIEIGGGTSALCGLQRGWTRLTDTPVKMRYGTDCEACQEELREFRRLKLNGDNIK